MRRTWQWLKGVIFSVPGTIFLAVYIIGCLAVYIAVDQNVSRIPNEFHEPTAQKASDPGLAKKLRDHVKKLESLNRVAGQLATTLPDLQRNSPTASEASNYIYTEFAKLQGQGRTLKAISIEVPAFVPKGESACERDFTIESKDTGFKTDKTKVSNEEANNKRTYNLEFEIEGKEGKNKDEIIVIGAHYDSDSFESSYCNKQSRHTPGADDNATGVAALIELAIHFAEEFKTNRPPRTIRFVAFANEEEPFFKTRWMGSYQYAERAKEDCDPSKSGSENQTKKPKCVVAMLSLETMGYFSDLPFSQRILPSEKWLHALFDWVLYVFKKYPHKGNFIAFVGNEVSTPLVWSAATSFKNATDFPFEGISASPRFPGIDFSDHWAFWQFGVPAIMVTDTAPNRNLCYHKTCDTSDETGGLLSFLRKALSRVFPIAPTAPRLDFDKQAQVVLGLRAVIRDLANPNMWPVEDRKK